MKPLISIVITTKNRCEDLKHTLKLCSTLTYDNFEILVYVDGSSDDTSEMIMSEFPDVRLFEFKESAGLISRRNSGAEAARGEFIVSLDDDSWFLDRDALEKTVALFHQYPKVGAIAYWTFDRKDKEPLPEPQEEDELSRQYFGCGYAFRKSIFLKLGGYRSYFQYGAEESEICLRLMDAGYYVLKTKRVRVFHNQTPVERRMSERHVSAFRNQLLCVVLNEPWDRALPHLLALAGKGFYFAVTQGLLLRYFQAWGSFFLYLSHCLRERKPIRKQVFLFCDKLVRDVLRVRSNNDLIGL